MVTIFENTPYRIDKNLIESYNSFMELLPNDSWALFRDADTLFLDSFYGELIVEAINNNKGVDCFTCLTNRIGNPKQLYNTYNGDDIIKHREIATLLRSKYGSECEDFTKPVLPYIMSGMCFILSKKAWKKIGGFKEYTTGYGKMLGVDNKLHIDLYQKGFKTKIIKGLYIYHWYRGGKRNDIKHLI